MLVCVCGKKSVYKYVKRGQRLIPIDSVQVCIQRLWEMATSVGNQLAQIHNKSYCPQPLITNGLAQWLKKKQRKSAS